MKIKHLLLIVLAFSLNACIDLYSVEFTRNNKVLVVEGLLTDNFQDPDTIKIRYSSYVSQQIEIAPVASANPIIKNLSTGKETKLIEYEKGNFLPPIDFKMQANEQYVLKFKADEQQYESTPEALTLTPPIAKIYDKFNPKSKLSEDGKTYSIANEIFIDFTDTPNKKKLLLVAIYRL
jgi:hypothetical protein